jgi:CRP-like cAMP-binding protein
MAAMDIELGDLPERQYAAGEEILSEGQCTDALFFLVSGVVGVSKNDVEIVRIDTPGAVFGEMSFLLGGPATATVRAVEPCTMKVVDNPGDFLAGHPGVTVSIAKVLAGRLDSLNLYLVDLKAQLARHSDHLGMVDDILGSIMNKHPRTIRREVRDSDMVDD